MKRILLIIGLLLCISQTYAQQQEVFVVFTSKTDTESDDTNTRTGVYKKVREKLSTHSYEPINYIHFDKSKKTDVFFRHDNFINNPRVPHLEVRIYKNLRKLSPLIDWDKVGGNFNSNEEIEEFFEGKKIFFIDKKDKKRGKYTAYQVRIVKLYQ